MIKHRASSLADQVYEKLEDNILTGFYKRDMLLTEVRLSEELGVSRTPIREALRRLEAEHMIEETGKGMKVLGVTEQDCKNIYEIRMLIEGLAARDAAKFASEDQIRRMRDALDLQDFYAMRTDAEKVREMDTDFHEELYRSCGNDVLYDTLSALHTKAQKYRKQSVENHDRAVESVKEHKEVLKAIIARDPDKAEALMTYHVKKAAESILGREKKITDDKDESGTV